MAEWIRSYRTVEALDFDIVAGGHGRELFDTQDVVATRIFFEDLRRAVSTAMADGLSLAEMQDSIELEQYADWVNYERVGPVELALVTRERNGHLFKLFEKYR